MKTVGAIIAIVLAVGGALASIDTFYARRSYTDERFAGLENSYQSMRLNQVDGQIVQIEREGRVRRLSIIEQELLRRLYQEREALLCQLRIKRC